MNSFLLSILLLYFTSLAVVSNGALAFMLSLYLNRNKTPFVQAFSRKG